MKTIGYKWTATSDDGVFHAESGKAFSSQKSCYKDMLNHAVEKMKWNVEWEDFDECGTSTREDGLVFAKIPIGYNLEVNTHKIVHTSYSGTYTYEIQPIEVDDEEAKRLEVVRKWITGEDGNDGALCDITEAYTRCNNHLAWEEVAEDWDASVPCRPTPAPADLDDAVLNMHLRIQSIANKINERIQQYYNVTEKKIAVVYRVNGEHRLYHYSLDDLNDCTHFFEDEQMIMATYVLTRDYNCEEQTFYKEMSVKSVTDMVLAAEKILRGER